LDRSTKKRPLYQNPFFIVVAALLAISGIANVGQASKDIAPSVSQVEASSSAEPPQQPSATPTIEARPEVVPERFYRSVQGDLRDMIKDLNDMVSRANGRESLRLLGNTLELSFNVSQLKAIDAPQSIANKWEQGISDLASGVASLTEAAGNFSSEEISLNQMLSAIDKLRAKVHELDDLAASSTS
jgi:hypothetical protein